MSVRRLAEPAIQPAAFAFSGKNSAWAKQTIQKYPKGREQSAVIPLLMRAQEQDGWVTKAAIEAVADMLAMPYIRALEVATFYTQFQLKPVGSEAHVQVCGTTPCMLRGSEALMEVCRAKIHHDPFHTNAAGTLSWEEVECLGACVNAPMVMISKDAYEDLTPERLAEIIDQFEAGKGASVPTGPQNGRVYSAPITGLTSLKDETLLLKGTRERQAPANANIVSGDQDGQVPPSNAGKPNSRATETDRSVQTPSPRKVAPSAETPSPAPAFDAGAANKAEPSVELVDKQRKGGGLRSASRGAFQSPEMLKGDPIGVSGKKIDSAAAKPSLDDRNRPAGIERPARPDDLKLISGVGPKIEGVLHSLGVYTFAQVASWERAERDWVDSYLNFRGRIDRDDWVRQAAALARDGEAEYIRVFGKKPR